MENNIDEDSLKRLNLIIEKTKAYDDCVFPVGTRGEFGALYISDLKAVLSELETYKKIAEKFTEFGYYDDTCMVSGLVKCAKCNDFDLCKQCIIDWARNEVEK